jgi:very-short-patch-repair endonuclease
MHNEEQLLRTLAARQHGLVHQRQLALIGLGESATRHLVSCGRWRRRTPSIIELDGVSQSDAQDAMLAVLDVGPLAAVSFQSSASRWALPGFQLRPLHVTGDRGRGRRREHLAIVHQPRLLLPDHVLELDGVRTTTPARTLFDLAGLLRWPEQVARALDNTLVMGLTTMPELQTMLRQLACRGRPGIRLMRELIEARGDDYIPPATNLEARFQVLARRAGIGTFVRQVNVGDAYDRIGRVDFLDRERKIVVEVQSARYHSALCDRERDQKRVADLRACGWTVIEIPEHDIWHRPDEVIRRLRALFR